LAPLAQIIAIGARKDDKKDFEENRRFFALNLVKIGENGDHYGNSWELIL
jgi:hypothetical protein